MARVHVSKSRGLEGRSTPRFAKPFVALVDEDPLRPFFVSWFLFVARCFLPRVLPSLQTKPHKKKKKKYTKQKKQMMCTIRNARTIGILRLMSVRQVLSTVLITKIFNAGNVGPRVLVLLSLL